MSQNAPTPIRHCPLCGVAMQSTRSTDRIPHLDRFECLSCGTTIEVPQRSGNRERRP